MGFEVRSLQLTDTIDPGDQVELERHLCWNSELCQRGTAFSLQHLIYASELPQCQWPSRLRGNPLSPDFFLLDVLDKIQYLSQSCWIPPAKEAVPWMVLVWNKEKEIDFFQKRMVEDLHPVGLASGPGLIDPNALRFIHLNISSAVIAERRSCENTMSLWYLCPSRKLRKETRVF
jgi:hypothetical protein